MRPAPVSPPLSLPLSPSYRLRRIAVIGGGISGLAAAHRFIEVDPSAQVTLLEASGRLGGVLATERRGDWLIERAADMFTTREPWAVDLCQRIGIAEELVDTDKRFRRAFVVRRSRLVPVPEGFTLMSPAKIWPIVTTPLLSPFGKLRLAWERFVPPRRDEGDESLQSFAVRRFGLEAFDRLIQPLIGGIYTADPAKLSMAATLPQFLAMEREYGSVTRGFRVGGSASRVQASEVRSQESGSSGARYGMFVAPRDGMQRLVDAIAARLPAGCVRPNSRVERIQAVGALRVPPTEFALTLGEGQGESVLRDADRAWQIHFQDSPPEAFDDLILATPGPVAARLLNDVDSDLARLVQQIPYAGCSVVVLGVRRDQVSHPLDGFGFVVPAIEGRLIIAGSLASVKFPGRAPEGHVLLRVFVGGALQPELGELPDDDIRRLVREELAELIGLRGEPELCEVFRWLGMMPQYHVGHSDLTSQIEARAGSIPHFALAGNAYRGVGIPLCIRSGEAAAERILSSVGRQ